MPLPPQPAGGLSIEHLNLLANHFDRTFAASQQVLLARFSKQETFISEKLSSISSLLCSVERRLLGVEYTCEEIKEEMRDPQANSTLNYSP
jgi:hypothetical protein